MKSSTSAPGVEEADSIATLAISQAIRNAMECFHGAFGDDKHGFITDEHMMRLNILVRKVVYDTLLDLKHIETNEEAQRRVSWNVMTFHEDHYEKPGSKELEAAYKKYVEDFVGIDGKIYKKWAKETKEGIL